VVEGVSRFAPDMVVVEALPPDWPKGKGRDYRPGFDLDAYAERWGMEPAPGADAAGDDPADATGPPARSAGVAGDEGPCHQAKRYFLRRDLVNAAYRWLAADCAAEGDSAISAWLSRQEEHEKAVLAFPVAREHGVREIVSFDYQGDDARWFFGESLFRRIEEEGTAREREEAREVREAIEGFRERAQRGRTGSFIDMMRFYNSDTWLELQEEVYEEVFPRLSFERSGRHQTLHYWLRNERMFDNIEEAVAEKDPERILVVVGTGHRYFLDELAKERGYRWVDPHDYLPEG